MKHALLAAVASVAVAASASATSSGNLAGKLNTKMNAQAAAQKQTSDSLVEQACARGETVTTMVTRTVPKFFAGRMVPRKVETEKTVCN